MKDLSAEETTFFAADYAENISGPKFHRLWEAYRAVKSSLAAERKHSEGRERKLTEERKRADALEEMVKKLGRMRRSNVESQSSLPDLRSLEAQIAGLEIANSILDERMAFLRKRTALKMRVLRANAKRVKIEEAMSRTLEEIITGALLAWHQDNGDVSLPLVQSQEEDLADRIKSAIRAGYILIPRDTLKERMELLDTQADKAHRLGHFRLQDEWNGYHGGFPVGLLERIRLFLPVLPSEGVWFFASGGIQNYKGTVGGIPLKGLSGQDIFFDVNPAVCPTYCVDLNTVGDWVAGGEAVSLFVKIGLDWKMAWLPRPRAIIIDLPYDDANHEEYKRRHGMPDCKLPRVSEVTTHALRFVQPGGRVAVVDWVWPRMDRKHHKCVAVLNVLEGEGKRQRIVTIWENR